MEFKHKSVLLEETIEGLDIKPDGIYVDGTLGGAGHAGEVCRKLSAKGSFIGLYTQHVFRAVGFRRQKIRRPQIDVTDGRGAVSYTHLDVYKRQGLVSLRYLHGVVLRRPETLVRKRHHAVGRRNVLDTHPVSYTHLKYIR